jgi:L-amino acid N-acyltransferase YncA
MIRPATLADAEKVRAIYNHYVATTAATFEEEPVAAEDMAERMRSVQATPLPWLVDEEAGVVVGYAYVAPWAARSAYRFTVESTIYVDAASVGLGRGTALYARLLALLPGLGVHTALAQIALPAPASVALHERCGFAEVARLTEVGFKFGRWVDVGIWQVRL